MDTLIEARGATYAVGARSILTGLDLAIARGEVVGIAGPNGAGKSTLGRLLLGLADPDAGTIAVDGLAPATYRRQRGMGFLHEDGGRGWARVTPRALLALQCLHPDALDRDPICQVLGVPSLLDRRIGDLSKGQWRLCQLAMALRARSGCIVLDEPEAGLDPGAQGRLHEAVLRCAQAGAAILLLSHHLESLAIVATRIHLLAQGRFLDHFVTTGMSTEALRARYLRGIGTTITTGRPHRRAA